MLISSTCARAALAVSLCAMCLPAAAQTLPSGPARAFDDRLVAGAEVSAIYGERDTNAFFNYTDYEHNALRLFRVALTAAWRPSRRLALVGEVRSEDFSEVRPYAAYVRLRPWRDRGLDIQLGRIPPSFGAFSRRAYGTDNPVVGLPLAYQYLTSLRADAVPASSEDLLRMRGRGWRSSFQVGAFSQSPGLPLVSAFRWDTGVQARWTAGAIDLAGSVTNGTLSNPRVGDDNGGKQVSARLAITPIVGLVLGASGARGAWLSRNVMRAIPAGDYSQRALGADAEYSRGHWLLRGEVVRSEWDLPYLGPARVRGAVSALGTWVEGRYRFMPRAFLGARVDRLAFSRITDSRGRRLPWDGDMDRAEAALGYYLQRNLVGRLSVQRNRRDAGRVRHRTYVAAQITYWF